MSARKMIQCALVACAISVSAPLAAQHPPSCWVLTGLAGPAMYVSDGFKPTKDGFRGTNPHMTLVFNGTLAAATGDDIGLVQVGDYMAVGITDTSEMSIVETYSVDPGMQRVFYTKSSFMRGPLLEPLTGTRSFVGHASPCK